jgi:hypothetical protein
MDGRPDRVLDVRATSGLEGSGTNEVVEGGPQEVERRSCTSSVIGECERRVEEAGFGAGELEIGAADGSEPEPGARRCVRSRAASLMPSAMRPASSLIASSRTAARSASRSRKCR